jgi:hypothetical protein
VLHERGVVRPTADGIELVRPPAQNQCRLTGELPVPDRPSRFDQVPRDPATRRHRAQLLCREFPYVRHLRIGLLGDDDLLSLELAATGAFHPVVYEIDPRVTDLIRSEASRRGLDVTVVPTDLRVFGEAPAELHTFVANPPYTVHGLLVAAYQGLRRMVADSSRRFYLFAGQMMLRGRMGVVQRALTGAGVYVSRLEQGASEYTPPGGRRLGYRPTPFDTSSLMVCRFERVDLSALESQLRPADYYNRDDA